MGHDHGPSGGLSAASAHRGRLIAAFGLTVAFLVVELVTALATGSLALLSDAAHMFTDSIGLLLAVIAVTVAARSRAGGQRTFGLHRMETLAALANAVLLAGVGAYVLYEAFDRIGESTRIPPVPLMIVAVAGLAINVISFLLLRRGAQESLALKAAATEVMADALGSVGVLVAGVVIALTGAVWVDTVIALALAVWIVPRVVRLARQSLRVLVEAAPEHVDVASLERDLAALPDVIGVHDVHVWTLTSGMESATAHLSVADASSVEVALDAAHELLTTSYGIEHATVQIESVTRPTCHKVGW